MGNANGDRANVLKFWRAAELFSPLDTRTASPCNQIFFDIHSGVLLPLEAGQLRRVMSTGRNTDDGRPLRVREEFTSCAWAVRLLLSPDPNAAAVASSRKRFPRNVDGRGLEDTGYGW